LDRHIEWKVKQISRSVQCAVHELETWDGIPNRHQIERWYTMLIVDEEKEKDSEIYSRYGNALLYQLVTNRYTEIVSKEFIFETSAIEYMDHYYWNVGKKQAKEVNAEFTQLLSFLSKLSSYKQHQLLRAEITWDEWLLLIAPENEQIVCDEFLRRFYNLYIVID